LPEHHRHDGDETKDDDTDGRQDSFEHGGDPSE
jgi:hypothetical protein